MNHICSIILLMLVLQGCSTSQAYPRTEEDALFDQNKWIDINKDESIKKGLIYE